jgi:hypothetical protein
MSNSPSKQRTPPNSIGAQGVDLSGSGLGISLAASGDAGLIIWARTHGKDGGAVKTEGSTPQ